MVRYGRAGSSQLQGLCSGSVSEHLSAQGYPLRLVTKGADVVDLVFNRPMTAIEGQDILWRCLLLTQAGDAERYLLGSFPTRQQVAMKVRGRPFDTKYLLDVGEVHVVVDFRAGPNFS